MYRSHLIHAFNYLTYPEQTRPYGLAATRDDFWYNTMPNTQQSDIHVCVSFVVNIVPIVTVLVVVVAVVAVAAAAAAAAAAADDDDDRM